MIIFVIVIVIFIVGCGTERLFVVCGFWSEEDLVTLHSGHQEGVTY